jgi:hypothetical protein
LFGRGEVWAMGRWRAIFEENLPQPAEGEHVLGYEFGPPAAPAAIAAAERALGLRLPSDLRAMLSEFNGVWLRVRAPARSRTTTTSAWA